MYRHLIVYEKDSSEYIPYRFTLPVPSKASTDPVTTAFPTNIWKTLINPGLISTEEVQNICAAPQAVFRVQAVSRCASTIPGHGEAILATQFSPRCSSRMVSGSGDNTARIWDCDTGTPVHTLKGHTSWVLAVGWSPDDSRIATGSMDNTVRSKEHISFSQTPSPRIHCSKAEKFLLAFYWLLLLPKKSLSKLLKCGIQRQENSWGTR